MPTTVMKKYILFFVILSQKLYNIAMCYVPPPLTYLSTNHQFNSHAGTMEFNSSWREVLKKYEMFQLPIL
jgi:hypothetical protein